MASKASNVVKLPTAAGRQWKTAKVNNLTADWNTYTRPIDQDIRHGLSTIRARARELAQNSDHTKGFLRIVRNNVVGATGFVLQSRAETARGKQDKKTRKDVEREWKAWGRRGNCEITGKFTWAGLQRHVIETVARDGESFVRILRPFPNRWGMTLQVIDPETVDIQFNGQHEGNEVRMGVELDADRRPVAYHLLAEPTITQSSYRAASGRYRVPAEEMLHVFLPEFSWQTRGVPWMAVSAQRLHMITGTEDAEVTATRASAAKFAIYEAEEWAPPPEKQKNGLVDENGNPLTTDPGQFAQDVAPGMMEVAPYGYKLNMVDPAHPNSAMPDFLKWGLRSVATGMGVSYNTLGNDAEGVNYTSLRFFLGVERDNWMEVQDWFGGEFPEPVREIWTADQLKLGTLAALPGRESELDNVYWQPRRWEGPDPAKQSTADRKDLEIGATTLTDILARKGRDFDDALAQRVSELKRAKEAAEAQGLTLQDLMPYLTSAAIEQPETGADANEKD